jgi:ubiquinone/menaquinone biosynthesis C-methylase UbiE
VSFLFPPEAAAQLDSAERLRLVPVDALMQCLPLKAGIRFVDVGCGTGTYFFPVFERLKGEGIFIAVELQEEMLRRFFSRLEAYAESPGFVHIEVARAKPERLPLPDSSADLILMANVYHEILKRPAYLKELRRVLCAGGTLCLLDWRLPEEGEASQAGQEPWRLGPPLESRVSESQALAELEAAGFEWLVSHSGFSQNWCLSARK